MNTLRHTPTISLYDMNEIARVNGWHEISYDINEELQRRMSKKLERTYAGPANHE